MAASDMTLDRMHRLARDWEASSDRRCIFLKCYALMTANMLAAIRQSRFHDGPWVDRLLHHFAGYYFDALELYEQNRPETPLVWKQTYDAARDGRVKTLQHLFLGINAHINYDLALTLVDVLAPEWPRLAGDDRQRRYDDHCLVNTIIGETVDTVQDQVIERHEPWLDIIDKGLGRLDEWVISHLITRWRSDVWVNAIRLLEVRDPVQRGVLRRAIEQAALRRGREILGARRT